MKTLISLLILAGLIGAGPLAAQQPPADSAIRRPMRDRAHQPPRDMGLGAGMPSLGYAPQRLIDRREALGLSAEQVGRLEALAQEAGTSRDAVQRAREAHHAAIADLWKADQPDVPALTTHMKAVMAAQQEAQLAAVTAAARAKAVLTAEQRGRVAGWADARAGMRRGRANPPRRPGLGPDRPGMRRGGMRHR